MVGLDGLQQLIGYLECLNRERELAQRIQVAGFGQVQVAHLFVVEVETWQNVFSENTVHKLAVMVERRLNAPVDELFEVNCIKLF